MKQLYSAIALLALTVWAAHVKAAECRVNGGPWTVVLPGGTIGLDIAVPVQLGADATRILLEGANLECRFSFNFTPPEWEDYWTTSTLFGPVWTPGPKFTSENAGLRINGSFRNSPVADGIHVATLPNNRTGYPIHVTPYILTRNNPANPIQIQTGDILGTLILRQTNNYDSTSTRLVLRYSAADNFGISPSTCTINNNNPIVIDFGNVDQRAIGTDPLTSTVRSDRRLTYNCPTPGQSLPITITYQGAASSFNSNLLRMTNPDVGTALVRGGAAVRVGGSFLTRITNSVGQDDVTFSLVRRAGVFPDAGPISGSGVLVMGVP